MNIRWGEASTIAQNFVLSLLVLDERKRLTAKQALQHSWFLNEHYQSRLEQLYEEAIRDWYPRSGIAPSKSENYLQQGVHKGLHKALRTAPTSTLQLPKNQVITSVSEKRAVIEAGRKINSVKEGSSNRRQNTHERVTRDKICVTQSSTSSPNSRRSFSPQAWKTTPYWRQRASPSNKRDFSRASLGSTPKGPKADLTTAQQSWAYTSRKLNDMVYMPTEMPAVTQGIAGAKRGFGETLSQSPEIGEVYEEIENKITGKVQRLLYKEK